MPHPFPFSDPHTVTNGPRALEETNSCSTEISFETKDAVSGAAPAETPVANEDTGPGTENPAMTDCVTSGALPSPSPSVSAPANPAQPNEVGGTIQPGSVSPCPGSTQESGPVSASEVREAGPQGENSAGAIPTPTGGISSPPGQGQMAPTEPCNSTFSNTTAASGATNMTLTTIVVQPAQKVPSTTLPLSHSETQALPEGTETGPVQAAAGSRSWIVGTPITVFSFGLLGAWLAV